LKMSQLLLVSSSGGLRHLVQPQLADPFRGLKLAAPVTSGFA
jgi:hypothetical protein